MGELEMKVWLIGAGGMAHDYIKVLEGLKADYEIIGRGRQSAEKCRELTDKTVHLGGLTTFLALEPEVSSHAIVAVGVDQLYDCVAQLIKFGVKNILVEKPGGVDKYEIEHLNHLSTKYESNTLIAYNRRFYQSTQKAKEIIAQDGGLRSCTFEFTEWSHIIEKLDKPEVVHQKWFIGNSTHVVDLAFHLIGKPKELSAYTQGSLTWHKSAEQFCGSGVTDNNIIFSYFADWRAPGRWSIEFLTANHRLIFKPMEELRVVKLGTVKEEAVTLDSSIDTEYKPGLYLQTETFLNGEFDTHCTIEEQASLIDVYYQMANY